MKVTAVVMAGGKGTRMKSSEEKPLLRVGGKPIIDRVIQALLNSRYISNIVVAVSDFTPKTARHIASLPVKVVLTPGKGYVSDLAYVVKMLDLRTVMTVAADLPLLTSELVDNIAECYHGCGKPALAVAVPVETKQKLGMSLEYAFDFGGKSVVPAGINLNDGNRIDDDWLDQEVYVLDKREVAVNINTVKELRIAEEEYTKKKKSKL